MANTYGNHAANLATSASATFTFSNEANVVSILISCDNASTSSDGILVELVSGTIDYTIIRELSIKPGSSIELLTRAMHFEAGEELKITNGSTAAISVIVSYEDDVNA